MSISFRHHTDTKLLSLSQESKLKFYHVELLCKKTEEGSMFLFKQLSGREGFFGVFFMHQALPPTKASPDPTEK